MIPVLFIAKIFILIGLTVYLIFALVVIRQINLMIATVKMGFDTFLRVLGWGHLAFALVVFLFALISL